MRGGGIDHHGAIVGDQRHRLARGIIGQTQDHDIRVVQRLAARGGVLAPVIIQRDQRKFGAAGQPRRDFKARGTGGAVDEDRGHAGTSIVIGT